MHTVTCPKCSKPMEDGFIVDRGHGVDTQAEWVVGPPQRSFWTGLKLRGKVRRPITTYCCPGCGFMESYAPPVQEQD